MYLKNFTILIFLCSSSILLAQNTFFYDTYDSDNTSYHEVFDSAILAEDQSYDLKMVGTYSVWSPNTWTDPCGDIETAPMFESLAGPMTGNVGFDPEYMYSLPDTERCESNEIPVTVERIEISLDNGVTWFHPTTTDEYNSNHEYSYSGIIGQGYPIGVRQFSEANFDDYGRLELTLEQTSFPTSLDDLDSENQINIHPNPSLGYLTIENAEKGSEVEIYNSVGAMQEKLLITSDKEEINLSNLAQGVYFIKIGSKTNKIILIAPKA